MLGRSRLLAAALMAGLASSATGGGVGAPTSRSKVIAAERGDPLMSYGVRKPRVGSVAKAKRAAAKSRNRIRNKKAHRG